MARATETVLAAFGCILGGVPVSAFLFYHRGSKDI
jgi:hypothetical protein